ncbi:hypothetical protein COL41_23995 [Bacillus mycoides]|nr:hypothetical protein COL41_23995 [Bacillus mycoides]QWH81321.1 hypothetical protein EXW59_09740 [Bacillus mycoides]QWI46733.1 hypothetical protein EXW55_02995 [Bacillus mycoides]
MSIRNKLSSVYLLRGDCSSFFVTIIFTLFDVTYNFKEKMIFSLIYLITIPISFLVLYKIGKIFIK